MTPARSASAPNHVLGLLLTINLVNYLDRYVLASLLAPIQADLGISDARAGGLASAFMVIYMLAALPVGWLADHGRRPPWIAAGIFLWSLATAASGLARNYWQLFLARAAVGIGESCYGTISPSFVEEHFPPERRGRVLGLFSMAIPVGSALGFVAGGVIGQRLGWRPAFFIVGLPGLALAALALRLRDPRSLDELPRVRTPSPVRDYMKLFKIPSFAFVTLAGAAMTFSLGGLAVWMPTYYVREWGLSLARAGSVFGAITVVSGFIGSLAGGWLSDKLARYDSRAYFLVSGLGMLIGMPLAALALLTPEPNLSFAALFTAECFIFLNMGPLNAVIVSVTPTSARSMAFAANIFVIHALGDAVSPTLIGLISDRLGLKLALMGSLGGLGTAGLLCLEGMRHYNADNKRAANG